MLKNRSFPVFLKSITIQGFKSFADRVKLELGHGLSVVVGPNGSGKSNVADAIRWVLGEQSAKTLRGNKMEDVIFAGSSARRPVGMAEVSLVFDNSTGIFPLEFQEVTITRRVYRDGEGQYFINKTQCRLKDIQELFMDTGAGKEGFSIIGQGRVEEILNQKAEERRTLIEEAAGITKYRLRKREALKRLDETERNLERLRDILNEIEGQLEPLALQAEKAQEAMGLAAQQRELEIQVVLGSLQEVGGKLQSGTQEVQNLRLDLASITGELNKGESESIQYKVQLNKLEEKIQDQQEFNYSLEQNLNNISQELRVSQERESYLEEKINRASNEVMDLEEKVVQSKRELESLEGRKNLLLKTIRESQKSLQQVEENLAQAKARGGLEETEALRKKLKETQDQLANILSLLNQNQQELRSLETAQKELLDEKGHKEKAKASYSEQSQLLRDQIRSLESLEQQAIEVSKGLEKELSSWREQYEEMVREYSNWQRSLERKQAHYQALKNLEDNLEGYNRGVRELLKAKKNKHAFSQDLCGTVGELIQVKETYETAIEIALGQGIQNIVTLTENGAKEAVQYLKTNKLGRATFLPLDVIQGGKLTLPSAVTQDPGFLGIAVDLISFPEKYRKAMESLLGRIIIVTDMDAATGIARKMGYRARIVTLDGDQVNPGGSLTGGSLQKRGTNLLSRSREIQTLEEEINSMLSKQKEIQKKGEEVAAQVKRGEENLNKENQKIQKYKEELAVLRTQEKNLQEELILRVEAEIQVLHTRLTVLQERQREIEGQAEQFQKEKERLEKEVAIEEENLKVQEERSLQARLEAEKLQETLTREMVQGARWEQELEQGQKRIKEVEELLEVSQIELQEKKLELAQLRETKTTLHAQQEKWEKEKKELQENLWEAQEKLVALRKEREGISKIITEQEEEISRKRQECQRLESKIHSLELKIARWETEYETCSKRLQEEFQLTEEEALAYHREGEKGDLNTKLQEIKRRLESLGPVNQAAIEEYPKLQQRYEFLAVQKEDLEEAQTSLHTLIGELDKTMSERFAEGFKGVNEAFQAVFKELFNGGHAELRLVEPKNLLETGVEIIAQPPGKKPQLLSLLSGGERALTAIGLLFALLRVKPSPFCVLDEIEASLDDANVKRFAQYIRRLSHSTQFLVISHRKGTMEAADVLYGIAMEESGVSKLLTVQLEGENAKIS